MQVSDTKEGERENCCGKKKQTRPGREERIMKRKKSKDRLKM